MAPARSRDQPPKKHTLTLAQIASYDDILTDALVDHAFYWTTIPKNRPSYLPSRGIKEEEISNIIQMHLVVTPDLELAEDKLLATNGLGKFYRSLKTDAEKEDFRRHLRRYMQIYLPDCPFEVAATNRYTIFQEEASICARRFIKCHETIKYLSGIQVTITPEEEAQLSARKKDFSIVVSSRKKEANIFMGPARFANHDCDANARLVTTGQAGIEIIATKPIGVGDEITVTYGDSYFGEDNCECLCKTCEDNLANGWAPADGAMPVKLSVEALTGNPAQGYSLRRREENGFNRGNSETPSLTPIARPKISRASLRKLVRTAGTTPALEDAAPASPLTDSDSQGRRQKRDLDSLLATPPVTPAKRQKTQPTAFVPNAGSREGSVNASDSLASFTAVAETTDLAIHSPVPKRASFTDTIEVFRQAMEHNEPPREHVLTPESSQGVADAEVCESDVGESIVVASAVKATLTTGNTAILKVEESSQPIAVIALPTPESSVGSEEDEKTSSAPNETALEEAPALPTPKRGRPRKYPRSDTERSEIVQGPQRRAYNADKTEKDNRTKEDDTTSDNEEDEPSAPARQRVPGDYTLTPLLLSEPETAWVICTVCSKAFVQRDAYFTRMSCPRCERHSKIYGYIWPKTEPEGKWDKEERILDHRLVHRFLHAEDEAKIRGRKLPAWRAESAADDSHESKSAASTGGKSGLGSGIWRKLRYTIEKEKAEAAAKAGKPVKTSKPAKEAVSKTSKTTKTTAKTTKITASAKVVKTVRAIKTATTAKSTTAKTKTSRAVKIVRTVKTTKAFHGPRRSERPRRASARMAST